MKDRSERAVCIDCREEFQYWPIHAGKRVRCDQCRTVARRTELAADPQEAACQQCGKRFTYLAWFGELAPKLCSDQCRLAYRANYMRRYRARVKVDRRRPCQICGKRRVLRWDESGFHGATWPGEVMPVALGFLCSAYCWVEYWKDRLVTGKAYDYDEHVRDLLDLRADAKQAADLEPWLTGDPEAFAWMAEPDDGDDDDNDTLGVHDDALAESRIKRLIKLRRSDGTR